MSQWGKILKKVRFNVGGQTQFVGQKVCDFWNQFDFFVDINLQMFIGRVFVGHFFLLSAWLSGQTGLKFRFFFVRVKNGFEVGF